MTYSRNAIAAFLLVTFPLAYACKKAEVSPSNRVTLSAYQSARVQNDVTIRVDSLRESRCPIDLTCIWGGNAVVKASLSKGADQKQVRLVLGPDPTASGTRQKSDSTGIVLSGIAYKVVLRDVTPYPSLNQPASTTPRAVIEVSKL